MARNSSTRITRSDVYWYEPELDTRTPANGIIKWAKQEQNYKRYLARKLIEAE